MTTETAEMAHRLARLENTVAAHGDLLAALGPKVELALGSTERLAERLEHLDGNGGPSAFEVLLRLMTLMDALEPLAEKLPELLDSGGILGRFLR